MAGVWPTLRFLRNSVANETTGQFDHAGESKSGVV